MLVINLASLYDEIAAMKDNDFEKQISEEENEIADWVKDAVGDKELAEHLSRTTDKNKMLELLDMRRNNQKLPKLEDVSEKKEEAEEEKIEEKKEEEKEEKKEAKKEKPVEKSKEEIKKEEKTEIKKEEVKIKEAKKESEIKEKEELKKREPEEKEAKTEETKIKPSLEKKVKKDEEVSKGIEKSVEEEAEIIYTFKLENGEEIKTVDELKEKLKQMDDTTFHHYVGDDYNHFANWIKDGLHKPELADKISSIKDKNKLLDTLEALENA